MESLLQFFSNTKDGANLFLFFIFIAGTITIILAYLSRGESSGSTSYKRIDKDLDDIVTMSSTNSSDIDFIMRELDAVKKSHSAITPEQREQLTLTVKSRISEDSTEEFLNNIQKKVEEKYSINNKYEFINEDFLSTISRLKEELYSLSKRSNLNLAIGIVTTILGLALLGTFVLSSTVPSSPKLLEQFIYEFIPRISLVILIEIFAYFFLKLYKETLTEKKYFQNEITTLETKQLALKVAVKTNNDTVINEVISNLISTERNFILTKGQTTVDLERSKIEYQSSNNIIDKFTDIVNKNNRK